MLLRLPMLIMRVEKVPFFAVHGVPVLPFISHSRCSCFLRFWLTRQQEGPKLIKKKFQLRDMRIDANTVSGAQSILRVTVTFAQPACSVRENRRRTAEVQH